MPRATFIVLSPRGANDRAAYAAANHQRVVDEAAALARANGRTLSVAGVAVWNGASRGAGDATASFVARAQAAGFPIYMVPLHEQWPGDQA